MYLPAKTLESVFNIDSLAMPFVNVTIHWLPFMVHFMVFAIAYLSNRSKRVNQNFCQGPAGLFDLCEIAVKNGLDWRIIVDNSALKNDPESLRGRTTLTLSTHQGASNRN